MLRLKLSIATLAVGFMTTSLFGQNTAVPDSKAHAHEHGLTDIQKQEAKIAEAIQSLPAEDRRIVDTQRFCPIMIHTRLGATGTPLKVMIEGKPVFVCCKSCIKDAVAGGAKTHKVAASLAKTTPVLAKLNAEERIAVESQ